MRGDIWRLNAGHTWLVELQDDLLAAAPTLVGVLITTRPQQVPPPLAVPLPATHTALHHDTWAKPTQLHTLPRTQLIERAGHLTQPLLDSVASAVGQILAIPTRL